MKIIVVIAFLVLNSFLLVGQSEFTKVDEFARGYKAKTTDVSKLTSDLTSQYNNDLDKVRSIFIWITNNIQYDIKEYRKILKGGQVKKYKIVAQSQEELAEKQRKMEEEQHNQSIKSTLSKLKGVCQDYSELFNEMCKYAHIKSGMIDGSVKDITGQYLPDSHAWNWVELKGKTYLLDATWASGFVDYANNKYSKKFNEGFFLTPPAMFIVNHFPSESKWQLLSDKVSLETFKEFPAAGPGFFRYKVKSFSPKVSKVTLKKNQLEVSLKFGVKVKSITISNNGKFLKEFKINDDDFSGSIELKKSKNNVDIWGDGELILSYKTK
jgi:transglutaminase/protease-like cytokinesis protein 3